MCLVVHLSVYVLESLCVDPELRLKGAIASCAFCCVLGHDPTDGRKADAVDVFKIHLVFNDFLLYYTQFDGIVLRDHVNDNSLLACGERRHLPHSCGSLAILQNIHEILGLQKVTDFPPHFLHNTALYLQGDILKHLFVYVVIL